jgi:hypothetical protein
MRALLTVTHHEVGRESYVLECPHGLTNGDMDTASPEAREKLLAGLLARHGTPFGCTCAAETDLVDAYPSVQSAMEQITASSSQGLAGLDDETTEDLTRRIEKARCPSCSVAILVLPLHLPLVMTPLHDTACPNAKWREATVESDNGPT